MFAFVRDIRSIFSIYWAFLWSCGRVTSPNVISSFDLCLCAKSLTFVKVTGRRVVRRPQKAEKDDKNECVGKAVRNHSRYVKWWSVITSHLSPNAIVPQRAGPRVAALWLGGFHPLVTVTVAATIGVLTDHHSPLETSCTGTGTLQSAHSANSKT